MRRKPEICVIYTRYCAAIVALRRSPSPHAKPRDIVALRVALRNCVVSWEGVQLCEGRVKFIPKHKI
ncbi:hypothetical protein LOAG_01999 [Loa loa]|uniref:Uncharacterized protein n=1 Tax=Loa loa TaxID=7209 RepID=A0A1S0U7J5_LOALO|nr:hypothetical protein LOAG_01999 [Loa loa]EFO26483.2 hypothetical protein LOAG_01999 [Loa loa]